MATYLVQTMWLTREYRWYLVEAHDSDAAEELIREADLRGTKSKLGGLPDEYDSEVDTEDMVSVEDAHIHSTTPSVSSLHMVRRASEERDE